MVDKEECTKFHKLPECLDPCMDQRDELLHECIIEGPISNSVPELFLGDGVNNVVLVEPVEFLNIKKSP